MPPRPIRPKNDPAATEGNDVADSRSGKRKAVSSACIPCRKRKSKCDGQLPACSTCVAVYRTECSYDADSDHRRKGALKRDIQSLQQQNDALDVIVASLKSLPENESIALLQSLRCEADPETLADGLRSNVRLPHSFAPQTLEADLVEQITTPGRANYTAPGYMRPTGTMSRHDSGDSQTYNSSPFSSEEQTESWFAMAPDAEFVEHLLTLYHCWVHPFYTFLTWDHFVHDMGSGKTDFCSRMLVNAILSLACHYSDRPMARTDPTDPCTAGDHFYAEAKRLLDRIDKPSLTSVQALGVMALRETSAGRDSNGYQLAGRCVRMALEMGLHLSVLKNSLQRSEAEVRKVAFWAVFNLETICSVAFGRLSQLPRAAADIETPSTGLENDAKTWRPYTDVNVSLSPSAEQPANMALFQEHLSKLSELASDMVTTFYAPRERFTSRRLAQTYAQYRSWYQNLPEAFHLENTSLPHVLVLHMYYYGCVLHLFRPYIKLDLQGADLYPRDTCTCCADQISGLMGALRAMYGLRRVTLAVPSLLLSASTIHLLNLPSESAAMNLSQSLHDLESMSVNHRFAARAVDIIRSLSSKWNIALPESAAAVTVYRVAGQRGFSSPPPSTFFAASIPRKQSSEGRARSGGSSSQESPFSPPPNMTPHQPDNRAPTSVPTFYNDPTTQLDPQQAQTAFWAPFPTQVFPTGNDLAPTMVDLMQLEGGEQWHLFEGAQGTTQQEYHGRQQSAPGRLADASMGGMSEWNWQYRS